MPQKKQENLWAYVAELRPSVEAALARYLPVAPPHVPPAFNQAAHYALFPGGKRLRPVLTLLGAEIVGGTVEEALPVAVAVEFVHTSSLIFDDLPCMDNAAERRGCVALHAKYGEGLAILVALAFLNSAYGLAFTGLNGDAARGVAAHRELVECIGERGMVAGQSVDLAQNNAPETVRNLKTSALMRLALRVGALRSGANETQLAALSRFAELLGDAYQISDDVLDLTEDAAFARDENLAQAAGAKTAQARVTALISDAKAVLINAFGPTRPAYLLCEMADYVAARAGK